MKQFGVFVLIAAAFFGAVNHHEADAAVVDKWQPCIYEDGSGQVRCVWDAVHMGNGDGKSFYKNKKGVHYISHARAHAMLARSV